SEYRIKRPGGVQPEPFLDRGRHPADLVVRDKRQLAQVRERLSPCFGRELYSSPRENARGVGGPGFVNRNATFVYLASEFAVEREVAGRSGGYDSWRPPMLRKILDKSGDSLHAAQPKRREV